MQSLHTGLRAGAATIDITPAIGTDPATKIYLSGYVARIGHAVGVHDPLYARALALSDGTRQALLVVCDLLGLEAGFSADTRRDIRRQIAAITGTPADAVMLACIHTHSSPATMILHECGEVSLDYLEELRPQLINVAERAATSMRPVKLDTGSAALPEGAYNRRGDRQDIDTEVGVAWLRDMGGETVAMLINYGCHPVVMTADNLWISADYPGAAIRALEAASGGTAFFLTGADGNVDPVHRGSFEDVEWLGQALADAVGQTLAKIKDRSSRSTGAEKVATVTSASEVLTLPLQPTLSTAIVAQLREEHLHNLAAIKASQETVEARIQRAMLAWADETLERAQSGSTPSTIAAPVQVIRVGSLVFVGIP
ncbi:MAG: neutral/alkaline non-lysosomal ceramidase N-terminal domain-containing protein, partial [Anaerolineae bacterium]|nr:neutral/alkaline non-lysosomal ceramidase N-terminal domain-containing protein [Anaerolineae bacterium]